MTNPKSWFFFFCYAFDFSWFERGIRAETTKPRLLYVVFILFDNSIEWQNEDSVFDTIYMNLVEVTKSSTTEF